EGHGLGEVVAAGSWTVDHAEVQAGIHGCGGHAHDEEPEELLAEGGVHQGSPTPSVGRQGSGEPAEGPGRVEVLPASPTTAGCGGPLTAAVGVIRSGGGGA